MPYRNFQLLGEEQISECAQRYPFRASRLITSIEEFILGAAGTRVAPADQVATRVTVYMTPPREVLRGVPDAAALVLVDLEKSILELLLVLEDYVDSPQDWDNLVELAERALETHR